MVTLTDPIESTIAPQSHAQKAALQSNVQFLMFGGAAGSLKSFTLLLNAMRNRNHARAKSIIFRKTNPELEELISDSREVYSQAGATYNESSKTWKFPSGASVKFRWCIRDKDIFRYQGHAYDFIGFDESTHFREFPIRYMFSRNRSKDPFLQERCRVHLATNPGGEGHSFHQHIFLGPTCPHCKWVAGTKTPGKIYSDATWHSDKKPVLRTTTFIPGNITDHNLLGKDYEEKNLATLPDFYAMALKVGCWAMFKGQYFDIWDEEKMTMRKSEMDALRKPWWPVWTGTDYGFGESSMGSAAASYLATLEPPSQRYTRGRIFVIDEQFAEHVLAENYALEQKVLWHHPGQRPEPNYLSPDAWNKRGDGHTLADQMSQVTGIPYEMASNDRVGGAMLLYTMLSKGEMVICRETCPRLIAAIPTRIHDEERPTDVFKEKGKPEDDVYDGWRYMAYSYVSHADKPKPSKVEEAVTSQDPTIQAIQRRQAEHNLGTEGESVSFSQFGDFRKLRGY